MSSQLTLDTNVAGPSRFPTSSLVDSPIGFQAATPTSSLSSTVVANSLLQDSAKRSPRRPPSRVIRTFQEVTKTINAEEWYEELECGVCAHVLGAPQALVPCGHSLCGPCAWEWIKKNNNLTCPHCRHQLHEAMPFVPNIVVDQIIERKLKGLPDSEVKISIVAERAEKNEAWKLVQASMTPAPAPRRRNPLDDAVFGFFGAENNLQNHHRRASRHLPALGAPVDHRPAPPQRRPTHPYGIGMNLAEIRRHEEEQHLPTRAEIRRLREASLRDHQTQTQTQTPVLDMLVEEAMPVAPAPNRRALVFLSASPPPAGGAGPLNQGENRRARSSSETPSGPRPNNARLLQSEALAGRQARGRVNGQGATRASAVVLSDSD